MKEQKGFIALMSAIIVSVTLLLFVATGSITGFYSRFNALDSELKQRSVATADACADEALLQLASDENWAGKLRIDLSTIDHCFIGSVVGGSQKSFKIQATSSNAVTNLQITINSPGLSVVSWQEVPNF